MNEAGATLYITYDIGNNYLLDIGTVEIPNQGKTFVAWLYRKDVGMKMRLCGAPTGDFATVEAFAESTENMWSWGIENYEAELLDSPVFAPTL